MNRIAEDDGVFARLLGWAARPLSFYWALILLLLIAGVVVSMVKRSMQWEAFAAAAVLAGVVGLLARVTGVPAWPWRRK